jgi:hypothetical protein
MKCFLCMMCIKSKEINSFLTLLVGQQSCYSSSSGTTVDHFASLTTHIVLHILCYLLELLIGEVNCLLATVDLIPWHVLLGMCKGTHT